MTDPWKDIRDNIKGLHEIDAEGERFFYVAEVESLLADADALLHVKRAAEAQNRMWHSPIVSEALATLPEYLKGA